MTLIQRTLPALIAAVFFSVAYGQQAAPAAADSGAAATVPPPACEQPPTHPLGGSSASARDWDKFNKTVKAYSDCITTYVANNKAKAEQYQELTNKYIDAGNKAINDFNAYINEVKKEQGAD